MRTAGIGAVLAQHADVAADHGAKLIGALEGPALAVAEKLRLVAERFRRLGAAALGPPLAFGEVVLEQAGEFAERRIDRDADFDRLRFDFDQRFGFGLDVSSSREAGRDTESSNCICLAT